MHSPRDVANKFFTAFAAKDFKQMNLLYAESSLPLFSDPIFPALNTPQVQTMWSVLLSGVKEFSLAYEVLEAREQQVTVKWQAQYLYTPTKRQVVNNVTSVLTVKEGLIVAQKDHFDLSAWARMALGPWKGTLVGWFPNHTIRPQALKNITNPRKG